jgi:hypothetical protein
MTGLSTFFPLNIDVFADLQYDSIFIYFIICIKSDQIESIVADCKHTAANCFFGAGSSWVCVPIVSTECLEPMLMLEPNRQGNDHLPHDRTD